MSAGLLGFIIGWVITTALAVVGFILLRIRGTRIRSMDPDPRIVRRLVSVGAAEPVAIDAARDALRRAVATSVVVHDHALTAKTGPSLRTWGQVVQIEFGAGSQLTQLDISTWPSRDLQTLDTHAGGVKTIHRFLKELGAIHSVSSVDTHQLD